MVEKPYPHPRGCGEPWHLAPDLHFVSPEEKAPQKGEIMCSNPAVQSLCPVSSPQAPFEVTSEKQALLRVIHLSRLGHSSLNEANSTLEVPGLFH